MTEARATATAWLGIGSNQDPERHVRAGVVALREAFGNVALSPVYRSTAVGFEGQDFLNLVARVQTVFPPLGLKHWLNRLEDHHGRERALPKFSDRTLDIDILLYDDLVLDEPGLTLPRDEILKFAHVLQPLADLDPDLVHPVAQKTMAELLTDLCPPESPMVQVDLTL